jgi:GNAT superfamily N-acetyltransferase
MRSDHPPVYLSSIDEERFGIKAARAPNVTPDNLPLILEYCKVNKIILLIARSSTTDLQVAQAMEREGFILMDTLVYYARNLVKASIPPDTGEIPVRTVRSGEEEDVRKVAAKSFGGYYGHYHADERLDREKCDETYIDWAYRSCISRDVADEVLVADLDGSIVGFATLRFNSPEEADGVLFGVAPEAQGRGVYRSFMINAMEWFLSKGAKDMIVSTQVNNIAVQKVWTRVGFEPCYSYYTFHKWFDKT